jgi:hypothetical protein
MPKPEDIKDEGLRARLQEAHTLVRARDYTASIRKCADAYLEVLQLRPALLQDPMLRAGRGPTAWPRLGANLELEGGATPVIRFHRDSFTSSEAYTYYEFTLSIITGQGL